MKSIKIITAFLLILSVIAGDGFAQQDTARFPAALLVQLSSEHNRIEALEKAKRHADAEIVKKDAKGAATAMIDDFSDHFDFCPVYYYVDTNIGLVKQKQFAGILMDAEGNILKDVQPKNYLIAWYGFPLSQSWDEKVVKDSSRYTYDPQSRSVRGLVVVDQNFRQRGYLYKLGYHDLFVRRGKYYYASKRFDIEYVRAARALNTQLYHRMEYHRVHGTIFDTYQ